MVSMERLDHLLTDADDSVLAIIDVQPVNGIINQDP